jgi:hypothetical protein
LLQDLADNEGISVVQSGGEGGFVALAGPDALDGVDYAPVALLELTKETFDRGAGLGVAVGGGGDGLKDWGELLQDLGGGGAAGRGYPTAGRLPPRSRTTSRCASLAQSGRPTCE